MCICHPQIDGLQLSSGGRGVNNGAWGVWLKNGADTLVKDFNAQARMVRDIAVQGLQPGTVIVNSEFLQWRLKHKSSCMHVLQVLGDGLSATKQQSQDVKDTQHACRGAIPCQAQQSCSC
jgi:hypothetical protein